MFSHRQGAGSAAGKACLHLRVREEHGGRAEVAVEDAVRVQEGHRACDIIRHRQHAHSVHVAIAAALEFAFFYRRLSTHKQHSQLVATQS